MGRSVRTNTRQMPMLLLSPCVIALATGCSRGGNANTLCTSGGGTTVSSNLVLSNSPPSPASGATGTGFLDIETKDESGRPKQKRCTMTLRPIDSSNTSVRVWTAGHCAYDPHTEEFKNSIYTLRIFFRNGYFSVPVQFEGFESLAKFARFINGPMIRAALPDLDQRIGTAMPSATHEACKEQETGFRANLGSKAKNIACFGRNEMRGLKATLSPDEKAMPLVASVLDEVRSQENRVMSFLGAELKKTLDAYLLAHSTEQRRIGELRSLAYLASERFCSATEAERLSVKSDEKDAASPDPATLCTSLIRNSVLAETKASLAAEDFTIIQDVIEDTTSPLSALRKRTVGSNNIDSKNISTLSDLSSLTPCDMGSLGESFWKKYVDMGPNFSGAQENTTQFGLSAANYFGFSTNSIEANRPPVARLFPLNSSVVSDFEYAARLGSGAERRNDLFLINYDKNSQKINPVKGASGSILSIFGSIPVALLSTVDGEPTSGGAGVTPLPEISDEDLPPASNVGC